ncbi:KpsF/GutQ family sugar-phosphate isomerase [Roseomonas marmotae]|uniref:KpsF/GutQ family sugar-phosphate isomerase n=1 Tax=Roseomonas marmotae TaxID=2768161 RepID=A0ABS3KC43_9PROT|nr:KpsF/GutQ family sugar-phosphate isomerase [Roseomonas marmotae]MBO1075039.1 KpsF/GutQ family sugar-phosphate isomerase [Roseomonas marmotae]QTI79927.1 KpsF/GutQ family sugar-phosphate isomerase [Roseomonas marmotae]
MDLPQTIRGDILTSARRTGLAEAEGIRALHAALDGPLGDRLVEAVTCIRDCGGRVIVTGMGKSGHVGRKIAATLASTGTPAYFVHPAEASHGDLGMIHATDVVLALSWSGEAPELADIIAYTRRFGVRLVAITSRPRGALGSAADIPLLLPAMPEACPNGLAPTTSTTMQLVMGDMLAVALLSLKGFSAQDFRQFHPGGKLGSQLLKVRELMHAGAEVPAVPDTAMLSQAVVEISSKRLGVTAVVDEAGRLRGVITDGDVRVAMEGGFVDRPVEAVMTRNPRCIEPDLLAQEALAVMHKARITSLFVVEQDRLLGVVHVHDLLRAGVA